MLRTLCPLCLESKEYEEYEEYEKYEEDAKGPFSKKGLWTPQKLLTNRYGSSDIIPDKEGKILDLLRKVRIILGTPFATHVWPLPHKYISRTSGELLKKGPPDSPKTFNKQIWIK